MVGKQATDNDHLTFNVAEPHDLWLHVAGGTPGSHVVIRNPERSAVPEAVTLCAAALAAWYSKARNAAAKVEVHVCRASDVKKARGAPAGQVPNRPLQVAKIRVAPAPFSGSTSERLRVRRLRASTLQSLSVSLVARSARFG